MSRKGTEPVPPYLKEIVSRELLVEKTKKAKIRIISQSNMKESAPQKLNFFDRNKEQNFFIATFQSLSY